MKNFNVKSILFTGMLFLTFSVFFTSCSKDTLTEDLTIEQNPLTKEQIIKSFEADPILDEVKELTSKIKALTKSQIQASGKDAQTIAKYFEAENEDAIAGVFTDFEMSNLLLLHNDLSYQLQQKYPSLYEGIEVSNDIATGLDLMMKEGANERGCSYMYWVCATAAGAPTFVCMVSTLPSWILPAICYGGYLAALAICVDTYC